MLLLDWLLPTTVTTWCLWGFGTLLAYGIYKERVDVRNYMREIEEARAKDLDHEEVQHTAHAL
jgi:hypothetical protein